MKPSKEDIEMIDEITKAQKDGWIYDWIPKQFEDEFENCMDGLRFFCELCGVYANEEQPIMLKAIYKKMKAWEKMR